MATIRVVQDTTAAGLVRESIRSLALDGEVVWVGYRGVAKLFNDAHRELTASIPEVVLAMNARHKVANRAHENIVRFTMPNYEGSQAFAYWTAAPSESYRITESDDGTLAAVPAGQ